MAAKEKVLAFAVQARDPGVLEIAVYDDIGETPDGSGLSAKGLLQQLYDAGPLTSIRLRINSVGGNVADALAIYSLLRDRSEKGTRIEVSVDGVAVSAATVVAAAGDEIRVSANAIMMIHCAWNIYAGNADALDHYAGILRMFDRSIADTYVEASGRRGKSKTRDEFLAAMREETWLDAAGAVEWGLADAESPAMDVAASLRPEDAARFRNAPQHLIAAKAPPATAATPPIQPEINPMNEKILAALGAKDEAEALANAEKAAQLITGAKAAVDTCEELCKLTGQPVSAALAVVQAWRSGHERLAAVEAERDEAKAALATRDEAERAEKFESAVKAGLEAGKLTVALEPWARAQSLEALEAFLAVAPCALPGAGKPRVTEPAAGATGLSAEELSVAARLNVTPEAFAAAKAERATTSTTDDDE